MPKLKTLTLAAVSLTALAAVHAASAQTADTGQAVDTAAAAAEVDTLIVTGSRATARTVASSPAPIDLLSNQAVEAANKGNLLETLNVLLPSFNLPNVATPNIGSMVRAGQLRGLNPDQTLVLINGKRRHATAFLGAGGFSASTPADLSLIASGAIDRIEVLRDGASAIYGSDAIAGVINIITDKADSGGAVSARYGQYYKGDGLTRTFKADAGFKLLGDGYLHLAGQIDDQKIVIRNSPIKSTLLFYFPTNAAGVEILPAGTLSSNPSLPAGATPSPKEATRNNNAWINQGHAPYRLEAVTVDVGKPLTAEIEAYGFGTFAHRTSAAPQNFRTPNRDEVVRAITPDGFTPVEAIREDDYEFTGGIKGSNLAGFGWDLSSGYARDKIDVFVRNSINPTYGLASQRDFYIGRLDYDVWTTNFDLTRHLDKGVLPFSVDLSAGAEHRRESYSLGRGDVQSYTHGGSLILDDPNKGKTLGLSLGGSQALPGFRPEDEIDLSRTSNAVYLGAALQLTDAWVVDLAGRYEDFSDFGDTTTGRISTRYDLFGGKVGLRGTVSTGFHAPALAAQAYKNTGNANTSVNHVLQVNSPEAIALGAKPLKPEKANNYSIGLVVRPVAWFNLAIDGYRIDIKDRIAQSTQFREDLYPGSGTLVAAAGFTRTDGISYFINAADSRTKGIELTAEATRDLAEWGRLRATLALNRNDARVTNVAATPAVLARFNIPVFSAGSITNVRYQAPLGKEVLGLNWTWGKFSLGGRGTHYGKIRRSGNPTVVATTGPYAGAREIAYDIGKLWVFDFDASAKLTDRVDLSIAVNNAFDKKPSLLPEPLLAAYQTYSYTNNGPVSAAGGFYSATLRYSW